MAEPIAQNINAVGQPLLAAPADPLGQIIFWKYFPYDQTRVNWERTKEQAAANPYATQYMILSERVTTQQKALDAMLKAIQDEKTMLEQAQAAATAARGKRTGGGGGGGGGLSTKDQLYGWNQVGVGEQAQFREQAELRQKERAKAENIGKPDPTVLAPNRAIAAIVVNGRRAGLNEGQIKAQVDGAMADPTNAIAKASQDEDPFRRASNAVNLEKNLVAGGLNAPEAKSRAAAMYNVDPGLVNEGDLNVLRQDEIARAGDILVPVSSAFGKMRTILEQPPKGAGGARKTQAEIEREKATTMSPDEQLFVQRYIDALADDYKADAADIGAGKPFKDQSEFDAGKKAYEKAANIGAYTRAQAPYFSPEFLKKGSELLQTKEKQAAVEEQFMARQGRTPLEVQQEQARLFLEQQRMLRGEPMPIPEPTDEAGKAWYKETKEQRPWLLDSMARANQILREEGSGVLERGMTDARRRRLTGLAKAERQLQRADRLSKDALRIAYKYGFDPDEIQDSDGRYVRKRSGELFDIQYGKMSEVTDEAVIVDYEKRKGPLVVLKPSFFRQPDVVAKSAKADELRKKGEAGKAFATSPEGLRAAEGKVSRRLTHIGDPFEFAADLYDINPDEQMDVVRANIQKRFENPDKAKLALDYYVARKLAKEHIAKTGNTIPVKPPPSVAVPQIEKAPETALEKFQRQRKPQPVLGEGTLGVQDTLLQGAARMAPEKDVVNPRIAPPTTIQPEEEGAMTAAELADMLNVGDLNPNDPKTKDQIRKYGLIRLDYNNKWSTR
jgi:hypothetical protein